MGKFVLLNSRVFAGGVDLTGVSNKIELSSEVEEKKVTNFGSDGWDENLGGLFSTAITAGGQFEAGGPTAVDDERWDSLIGRTHRAWTINPIAASVGELAWITKALTKDHKILDAVGEVAPWSASAAGSWPLLRGVVLHPPGTARTATGSGTAVQHVAVPAGQHLYAALHVLSVAGTSTPTLTVSVQSDVDGAFASPATVGTFAAATAVGDQILRFAGPITDTWYRASWTISGTSPSFLFVASIGVG